MAVLCVVNAVLLCFMIVGCCMVVEEVGEYDTETERVVKVDELEAER